MGDAMEMQGTVESSADLSQNYSYVVHGAEAFCPMGSRAGRLTIPFDHGTYMHDMPIMDIYDCKEDTNVKCFGFCNSISNPDRLTEVEAVMKKVEEDKNLLDGLMDGLSFLGNAIASVFGFGDEPDPDDPYHGYGEDVYKNVLVCCRPSFAVANYWDGGTNRLKIQGINALNSNCKLICLKDCTNGIIQIMNDGQENAAMEQSGAADMASWQPGDPYPQATQGNLEALDANLADLNSQLEAATTQEERDRIQAEIDGKTQLRDEMASTLSMVSEMQQSLAYAEDEESYRQTLQDIQTVRDAFANGTPIAPVSEEQLNNDMNTVCQIRSDNGDMSSYLANGASDERNIYCNGRLMSQSEYNQYTVDCVDSMMPQEERNWFTGEVVSSEPKEMTTAEKVWDALIPGVREIENLPLNGIMNQ